MSLKKVNRYLVERKYSCQLLALIAFLFLVKASLGSDESTWSRGFLADTETQSPHVGYAFVFLTSSRGHLVGEFQLTNTSPSSSELREVATPDGKFWPNVVCQVTTGATKEEWK